MILWIISTLLTSMAAVLIAGPVIWRYAIRHSAATFEAKAGMEQARAAEISTSPDPTDANRAQPEQIEVEPPPLAQDQAIKSAPYRFNRIWAAAAVTSGIVVVVCVGIYASGDDRSTSGDTSFPSPSSIPAASQSAVLPGSSQLFPGPGPSTDGTLDQLQRFLSGNSTAQGTVKTNPGLPPVDELIQRLTARLQKNPRDISGWRTLGWANFNIQHYDDAAAAYAKAIELYPNVADLYSARGEALVRAANGTVTAESKQSFSEALKLDSNDLRARFFNGLAKAQGGDKTAALDILIEVANDAGPNEPIIPTLQQRIAELAKELNVDVNKRLHRPSNPAVGTPSSQTKGREVAVAPGSISQSEAKPDASHPSVNPADQGDMIGGMVERLTSRLSRSPRDVDGWLLLIRSRQVLNDPTAARETFERALKVFEESSPERDRLVAGAKSLGLTP